MYSISFISQKDFEKHVSETVAEYNETLKSIDLDKFNSNIIDPIKLTFDKKLYKKDFETIIEQELYRQRDKTNTNAIGYFNQKLFRFVANCIVPDEGWDVIFNDGNKTIVVEMKNKHNTMNSSSSKSTYLRMQDHILNYPNDYCYLVEVIAPHSRNIPWKCTVDKQQLQHQQIRRVSIDQFYKEVTGVNDAFYQICKQLPITLDKLIAQKEIRTIEQDTVLQELQAKNPDILKALYLLAFESYEGFNKLTL